LDNVGGYGGDANGGGIYSSGALTISSSTVSNKHGARR